MSHPIRNRWVCDVCENVLDNSRSVVLAYNSFVTQKDVFAVIVFPPYSRNIVFSEAYI